MAIGSDSRAPYDALLSVYLPVAAAVFVVVLVALAVVVVRFRAGRGHAPSPRASAPRLEHAYALALAVVAGLLLWRSLQAMSEASPYASHRASPSARLTGPGLALAIVASRWNWRITYPGGVVQAGDGAGRPATLVVPARRLVRVRLTSSDVVHALWIPALRAKYDAVPGYANVFALRFAPGLDYTMVRCSEFCGVLHDEMRLRVDVRAPRAFDAWLRARRAAAKAGASA